MESKSLNLGDVGGTGAHVRAQLFWFYVPHVGAYGLYPRPIRRRTLFLVATAPQYLGTPQSRVGGQLLGCASLPYAWLTDQGNQPSSP